MKLIRAIKIYYYRRKIKKIEDRLKKKGLFDPEKPKN